MKANESSYNAKILANYICSSLNKSLEEIISDKSFFNLSLTDIENVVFSYLSKIKAKKLIHEYDVGSVTSLWKSMTIKEKIVWYWYNKIFTFMGNYKRMKIDLANFEGREVSLYKGEDWIEVEYPSTLNRYPRSILVSNIAVTLYNSPEIISFNTTIRGIE